MYRKQQNYCCAICGIDINLNLQRKLAIDHDHKTGKAREIFYVQKCNVACKRSLKTLTLEPFIKILKQT
jgi:hypothetical protein